MQAFRLLLVILGVALVISAIALTPDLGDMGFELGETGFMLLVGAVLAIYGLYRFSKRRRT